MRDVLLFVALWCGAVTAVAAAFGVLWKLVSPHVDRYVKRQTAPLASDLEQLRSEIVSDAGDPSLLEAATSAVEASTRVEGKVDALHNQLGALRRRVEQVHGRAMMTQSVLDQHVQESNTWLGRAVEALEEQGIDLPDRRAGNPHDDRGSDDAEQRRS